MTGKTVSTLVNLSLRLKLLVFCFLLTFFSVVNFLTDIRAGMSGSLPGNSVISRLLIHADPFNSEPENLWVCTGAWREGVGVCKWTSAEMRISLWTKIMDWAAWSYIKGSICWILGFKDQPIELLMQWHIWHSWAWWSFPAIMNLWFLVRYKS